MSLPPASGLLVSIAALSGEWITKLTVWLALVGFALAAAMLPAARARWIWTAGCACLLAHLGCAFGYSHGWSHAAAYRETARQTQALTGLDWGGGIFLNYLFAAAWLADVLWWWLAPASFRARPPWFAVVWQGFGLFMIFNAAIVFGKGPVRVLGMLICAGLAGLWCFRRR